MFLKYKTILLFSKNYNLLLTIFQRLQNCQVVATHCEDLREKVKQADSQLKKRWPKIRAQPMKENQLDWNV